MKDPFRPWSQRSAAERTDTIAAGAGFVACIIKAAQGGSASQMATSTVLAGGGWGAIAALVYDQPMKAAAYGAAAMLGALAATMQRREAGGLLPIGYTEPGELLAGNYRVIPGFNPDLTKHTKLPLGTRVYLRLQEAWNREAPSFEREAVILGAGPIGYTATLAPVKQAGVPDFFDLDNAHIFKVLSTPPQNA
jgi:hypothetical protein